MDAVSKRCRTVFSFFYDGLLKISCFFFLGVSFSLGLLLDRSECYHIISPKDLFLCIDFESNHNFICSHFVICYSEFSFVCFFGHKFVNKNYLLGKIY